MRQFVLVLGSVFSDLVYVLNLVGNLLVAVGALLLSHRVSHDFRIGFGHRQHVRTIKVNYAPSVGQSRTVTARRQENRHRTQ